MTKKEKSVLVADELSDEATTDATAEAEAQLPASTLIEFPGSGRLPPWRKELSERVREIQARRAREAALEAEEAARRDGHAPSLNAQNAAQTAHGLGLVPQPETPEINPIVAAALRRIERARQQQQQPPPAAQAPSPTLAPRPVAAPPKRETRTAQSRAANGRARTHAESDSHAKPLLPPTPPPSTQTADAQTKTDEAVKNAEGFKTEETLKSESAQAKSLVALPTQPATDEFAPPDRETVDKLVTPKVEDAPRSETTTAAQLDESADEPSLFADATPEAADAPAPVENTPAFETPAARLRASAKPVIDDSWLSRLEDEILPKPQTPQRTPDDTAPPRPRAAAAAIDLLLVGFLSSPFAAVIELTSGNWSDPRVAASMGGIVLVVMFLYLTGSTALAGRTWGMSLFSLHVVDAETALAPSVGQSARRALVYMVSLATLCVGIIYALFDAERRTAHDHLSGTVVVRE
ncbi:MAG TPA: RDD family protein [Pyrinomonadaceae bacterium]|nr:RDD family protein [Pyrinomonadaceae bacterium]